MPVTSREGRDKANDEIISLKHSISSSVQNRGLQWEINMNKIWLNGLYGHPDLKNVIQEALNRKDRVSI